MEWSHFKDNYAWSIPKPMSSADTKRACILGTSVAVGK